MTAVKTALLCSALSGVMAAGPLACQSEAPVTGRAETYEYPWLTVGSGDLRAKTRVGDARRVRDESGLLYVSVPVRNTSDLQLYVAYRVTFFDQNQSELSVYRGTLTLPPNAIREATANSTSPRAESFQMELNYPRVN